MKTSQPSLVSRIAGLKPLAGFEGAPPHNPHTGEINPMAAAAEPQPSPIEVAAEPTLIDTSRAATFDPRRRTDPTEGIDGTSAVHERRFFDFQLRPFLAAQALGLGHAETKILELLTLHSDHPSQELRSQIAAAVQHLGLKATIRF